MRYFYIIIIFIFSYYYIGNDELDLKISKNNKNTEKKVDQKIKKQVQRKIKKQVQRKIKQKNKKIKLKEKIKKYVGVTPVELCEEHSYINKKLCLRVVSECAQKWYDSYENSENNEFSYSEYLTLFCSELEREEKEYCVRDFLHNKELKREEFSKDCLYNYEESDAYSFYKKNEDEAYYWEITETGFDNE